MSQFSAPSGQYSASYEQTATASAPLAGTQIQDEKPSIFIKLDRFQKSIKQKMKNTFNRNSEPGTANSSPRQTGKQALASSLYGNNSSSESTSINQGWTSPAQTPPISNQISANQQTPNSQFVNPSANAQVDLANYQLPGPNQANTAATINSQYPVSNSPSRNSNPPVQQPMPPNAATPFRSSQFPAQQTSPAMGGVPSSGTPEVNAFGTQQPNLPNGLPPTSYGVQLGGQQITATEHALRLKDENEKLIADRESLIERNMRLQRELEASKTMIGKLNAALSDAEKSLDEADSTNRALRQQLASLRSEHERSLLATDRMLDSLRAELDDMLMREITIDP
jgi:hypothetical protein